MRKKILSLLVLMSAQFAFAAGGISSGGDCFPVEWNLPNRGKGCIHLKNFESPKDSKEYQVWVCADSKVTYLMKFKVQTEEGENRGCRVFEQILQETEP